MTTRMTTPHTQAAREVLAATDNAEEATADE